MERQAERHLLQTRQKRAKIEKDFYDSIDDESGRRLHAADVNIGIARGIQRVVAVVGERLKEYVHSDGEDNNEVPSMSHSSDTDSDVEV